MKDNFIAVEATPEDLEIVKEYADKVKISGDWAPFPTYDLVQMGWPVPDCGGMVARPYGGIDEDGNLLPGGGMWAKATDAKAAFDAINAKLIEAKLMLNNCKNALQGIQRASSGEMATWLDCPVRVNDTATRALEKLQNLG